MRGIINEIRVMITQIDKTINETNKQTKIPENMDKQKHVNKRKSNKKVNI